MVKHGPGGRRRSGGAIAALLAVATLWGAGCASSPDTPENAVIDFLVTAQTQGSDEANAHLCDRLRTSPTPAETEALSLVSGSTVYGDGLVNQDGNTATVALRVVTPPAAQGSSGDRWEVEVVREQGSWRPCRFTETPTS